MAGGTNPIYGRVRASEVEQRSFETSIDAQRITEVPSNLQMLIEYDGSLAEYLGFADRGIAQSASGWLLQKFTYDASGKCTQRSIAYDAWSDRASADYA